MAVTEHQIEVLGLPTRPPKQSDPRNKKYSGNVVEIDAIRSDILMGICTTAITKQIPISELEQLRKIEEMEADSLKEYFGQIKKLEGVEE